MIRGPGPRRGTVVRTGHKDLARAARSVPGRARGDYSQLSPKVALVCDWLTVVGGAEKVLLELHKMYPDAPIYTSQYDPKGIDWFKDADVRTGWMQIFPAKLRRILPLFRQLYFSHLDLSDYDLVISVTGAEAKSVKTGNATHLCYCHVPTQYYWQMYDDYVKDPGFGPFDPIVRFCFKVLVKPLRRADFKAAQRPTQFIANSTYSAEQIQKYYHRDAVVIAPPVNTQKFSIKGKSKPRTDHFIITARQVTWKRHDLAIKACIKTHQHLDIIGDGAEHERLVSLVNSYKNGPKYIHFYPFMEAAELKKHLETAKGFLFPSLESFGIATVEALASGCPVIAYGEGGSRDFIKDGENGLFFAKQTVNSLASAIKRFDQLKFSSVKVSQSAGAFSEAEFRRKIRKIVKESVSEGSSAHRGESAHGEDSDHEEKSAYRREPDREEKSAYEPKK